MTFSPGKTTQEEEAKASPRFTMNNHKLQLIILPGKTIQEEVEASLALMSKHGLQLIISTQKRMQEEGAEASPLLMSKNQLIKNN
jgi:hypothetical protein